MIRIRTNENEILKVNKLFSVMQLVHQLDLTKFINDNLDWFKYY